jgi:hypothetical protein
MWPFKVERKNNTPAEEKLEQIKDILFPPCKLNEEMDKDGSIFKWQVDYSVDMNLDAALTDLEEGHNDVAVHNTIRDISKRLYSIRKILDAYMELDPEAKYIMVESSKDNENVEDIQ